MRNVAGSLVIFIGFMVLGVMRRAFDVSYAESLFMFGAGLLTMGAWVLVQVWFDAKEGE